MSKIPVELPPDPYPEPLTKGAEKNGLASTNILLFVLSFAVTFGLVWLLLEIF